MEKHAKMEQQLSEEHLQAITGGCARCEADLTQAENHVKLASNYTRSSSSAGQLARLSQTDAERERWQATADRHTTVSLTHLQSAQTLLMAISSGCLCTRLKRA